MDASAGWSNVGDWRLHKIKTRIVGGYDPGLGYWTGIVGGAIRVRGWPFLEAGLTFELLLQRTTLAGALPARAQVASMLAAGVAQLTAR